MIRDTAAMDKAITKRVSRRVWVATGIGLLLIGGGAVLYPSVSRWASAQRSVDESRVRIATVVRGDLERDLGVQGRIVAAFHPTLYSPEEGIVRLLVDAGDPIRKGQELAVVESPALDSRLKQEESSLLSARAELDRRKIQARQRELENQQAIDLLDVQLQAADRARVRAEKTREAGLVDMVAYEKAQDDYAIKVFELKHAREKAVLEKDDLQVETRNQELQVERQQLLVQDVRRQVAVLTIRSPADGLVSRREVAERDAVTRGQALLGVVDLSEFEIEIQIPESYADEIGPQTAAVIKYDNVDFTGRVTRVSPEVTGSQVRGLVRFGEASPEGLKQNQRVSVRLLIDSHPGVLKVARGPFLEDGGGHQAYVLDGDLAILTSIEVGAVSIGEVEIVSGLDEGDRIIISDVTRFEKAETILIRR
jgi:HlyD family secretion protein